MKRSGRRGAIFPLRMTSGYGVDTMSKMEKREEGECEEICRMYSDVEDDNDYDDDRNWRVFCLFERGGRPIPLLDLGCIFFYPFLRFIIMNQF